MNNHKTILLIAALGLSLTAATAQAEGATFGEALDAETIACHEACDDHSADATATAEATVTVEAAPAPAAPAGKARGGKRSGGRATASATARINLKALKAELESRIASLEASRATQEGVTNPGFQSEIDALKASAESLLVQVNAMITVNGNQDGAIKNLADMRKSDEASILNAFKNVMKQIRALQKQAKEKEENPFGNSVGLDVGVFILASGGGMDFVAPYVGGRLNLGLSREFYAFVAPALLIVPGDDNAFSAMINGGIGYRLFGDGQVAGSIHFGVNMVALELDNELEATAIAILPTAGLNFRLPENFRVGGSVGLGPVMDGVSDPKISMGAALNIGYDF